MKKIVAFLMNVLLVLMLSSGVVYAAPADNVQDVTISGPVCDGMHGWAYGTYFGDIRKYNYIEEEYFLSGTAQSCQPVGELTADGRWTIEMQNAKPYKTRILVRRPADAAKFNGTVIVEWADMSNGYELTYSEAQGIYENGFAYVSVTADQEGADSLREWDNQRYGDLNIPNAGMAYDIFTQAAQAIGPQRQAGVNDPMDGLEVKQMVAVGVSDAGSAILSYANAVQPINCTFDALIIAVCGGEARDFSSNTHTIGTLVRSDLTVPVMVLNSQSEALNYAQYRQPDTDLFRSWEIAGASHAPDRQSRFLRQKTDRDGITDAAERKFEEYLPNEVNWLYTLDAAYLRVHEWITDGTAPQSIEPIVIENNAYVLDEYGNVLGGVRLPEMEIPTARYVARPDQPQAGYTIRFSEEELTSLYPDHEAYITKVTGAADEAENAGVILPYRTEEYTNMAMAASVPVTLRPDISNPLLKYLYIAAVVIILVIVVIVSLIVWRVRVHRKKKSGKRMIALLVAAALTFSIGAAEIFPTAVQAAETAQTERQSLEAAATQSGFTVTGPITGGEHGWAFGSYFGDISKLGYVEEEYFLEGEAKHYQPAEGTALTEDGMWTLEATDTAPYKTRFIVRRPKDPDKFNGIVIVEWANVSGGYDLSLVSTPGIYNEGFAYVSVMTQRNGVYGFEENPQGLVYWDEERYGSLNIPDDGLSYDIFTQAARAIGPDRPKTGIDPMGGLEVKMLFAMGESQSGGRLLSYANGIQPIEDTFDAIITLVNSGRGNDFLPEEAHGVKNGKTVVRNISSRVREDINCKVFIMNSQSESLLMGKLVQPDTENIRSWQMAGVSHFSPAFMADEINRLRRDGVTDTLSGNTVYDTNVGDWAYIFESVLVQLKNWIEDGTAPLSMEKLEVKNMLLGYKEDEYGNALGGVRLPELEVPTAQYFANTLITGLIGYKIPFTEEQLKELYPTHQDYVNQVTAAAIAAEEAGIILPYRVQEYIREAETAPIPTADVPEISN